MTTTGEARLVATQQAQATSRIMQFCDLETYVGSYLGASGWHYVRQEQTDQFANLTGDDEWIHVDVGRAERELGGTIIHGYYLLSLVPLLGREIYRIEGVRHGLNYGLDRLRFIQPIAHGAQIRLHQTLSAVEPRAGGSLVTIAVSVELSGSDRPAMVADCRFLLFPELPKG